MSNRVVVWDGPRICQWCKGLIPDSKRRNALYCSRSCKEQEWKEDPVRNARIALRSYYKTRYGLTPEQAEEMRKAGCSICGRMDSLGRWGKGHIDHDHKTGRVRGVLCDNCNTGLGKFKDDSDLLRRAADYLDLVP